ncbi:MAG: penicillin-binding transpeptidase domain-containing protein [Planctomycetota bacterium]
MTGGDILALVSLPAFDLNRIRYDYRQIESDPNAPLLNRAINKQYPPGSVVKPMILIAALESGKSTADDVISCPARKAPKGWPSCWRYNRYRLSHDGQWENNAHHIFFTSCRRN